MTLADVSRTLADVRERWNVPGMAIGVLDSDQITTESAGQASLLTGLPTSPDTLFQVGSISKVFTATVIMMLVEEGRLEIDDPVTAYLPDFRLHDPRATERVSIRHLLTHTGGFDGDSEIFNLTTDFGDNRLQSFVETCARREQEVDPGALWAYNNAGFNLAGAIVERVEGEVFERVIQHRILDPLDLTRTFYFARDAITYPCAVGHNEDLDGSLCVARSFSLPRESNPAGGVISTVGDLLRFASTYLPESSSPSRLLRAETISAMQSPEVRAANLASMWGLGWMLDEIDGVQIVHHAGWTNGFRAQLTLVPAYGVAIAALSNGDGGVPANREITDWVLDELYGLIRHEPEQIQLDGNSLDRFVGAYRHKYIDASVTPGPGGLVLSAELLWWPEAPVNISLPLQPIADDEFVVTRGEFHGSTVRFVLDGTGNPLYVYTMGRLLRSVNDAP